MHRTAIDFLGIGAQKAGTTWLWSALNSHPDIWMPPKKEVHYFDRSTKYPSRNCLSSSSFLRRLIGDKKDNRDFRKLFKDDLFKAIGAKNWDKTRWMLKYYLGYYNDQWYLSLFDGGEGKLTGEITPAYSMLDLGDIRYIKSTFPDLKVILLIRNPIDRAWSHVRFSNRGKSSDNFDDLNKIKAKIESPGQLLRSDYVNIISNWSSCFGKNQFFIGFFDDILLNPRKIIIEVSKFLDLDPWKCLSDSSNELYKPKNVSIQKPIPHEIECFLASKYYSEIKSLSDTIGGYAEEWLTKTERILENC